MSQIFVSHSKEDQELVDFLARVAVGTKVRLVFEELEKMVSGQVSAAKIRSDIESSTAVFIIVTRRLHTLPHTRDWVLWESGVATNRDIWVFEPLVDLGTISVITPFLKHLALFEPSEAWFPYVRQIIESYDDSHVLGTMIAGTGLGAAFGKSNGALLGAGVALLFASMAKPRPIGMPIRCSQCASSYSIHVPTGQLQFRCPVCNTHLQLQFPTPLAGQLSPVLSS